MSKTVRQTASDLPRGVDLSAPLQGIEAIVAAPSVLDRPQILNALGATIRESIASGRPSAAILLDLNRFADLNAAWGPDFGDEVIAAVGEYVAGFAADHLSDKVTGAPRTGRLDADHFAVVVTGVESISGVEGATAELVRLLSQSLQPTQSMGISARAAIVQIPLHGRNVTTVLGRGFRLLNSAARSRADGVALSDSEPAQAASTVLLERELAAALSTDQLYIALQPKVSVTTGAVEGAEALARWEHPERGPLGPLVFIETAEKSGLIFDLGLRILSDACRASRLLAERGNPLPIGVNVSQLQLAHPEFLSRFLGVIDREGIVPSSLEIEITESAAMMGGEHIVEALSALRRCGIGVAIDDFGTGFSNLASLSALPADTLKIDRSLVTGVERGGKAGALLDIAVNLARTFGLATVAEGVETTRQYNHVTAAGCDFVQGYFTGRPKPVAEFVEAYASR